MRLRSALAHPRIALGVALLGVLLTSGSLFVGLAIDDHMQKLRVAGASSPWGVSDALDLYHFVSDANRESMLQSGALPWWSAPDVQIRFWRPLSAATHWLDYSAWPRLPVLMHLHSLVWFGLALWLVARLYARLLEPSWVAGLAALLYAVDEAHGMAVGFLANRNALIAMAAGALCLSLHQRWRHESWRPGAVLAPAVLGLGLLAGESAIFAAAYLFAYALCLDRRGTVGGLAALWPYALVVLAWRTAYLREGFGATASQAYIDPGMDPLRFVGALGERLPLLLLAQWTPVSADLWMTASEDSSRTAAGVALLVLLALAALVASLLWRDRTARFCCLGMLLAAVPTVTTFSNDRLLFGVGLGAMGLVALFLGRCWPASGPGPGLGFRVLAVMLLFVHLGVAPLELPLKAMLPWGVGRLESKAFASLQAQGDLGDVRVLLVNSPGWLSQTVYAWLGANGRPQPRCLRQLSITLGDVEVTRPDPRTLRLRAPWGLADRMTTQLMRPADRPFAIGDEVRLDGLTVTIEGLAPDGRPNVARFRFDVALEDPALRFLVWETDGYRSFAPPAVGATVRLPPLRLRDVML